MNAAPRSARTGRKRPARAPDLQRGMFRVVASLRDLATRQHTLRRDDFGDGRARPVVLLHGFGAPRRILRVLETRLRAELGVSVVSFHLAGLGGAIGWRGIDDDAAILARKLEALCQRCGVQHFDVIGHSRGGLLAWVLATTAPVADRVRTLITLGTPFAGSPLALAAAPLLGGLSRSLWQIVPRAPALRRLGARRLPEHVRFVSIAGERDAIAPARFCTPPAAAISHCVLPGLGHHDLVTSTQAFAVIASEVRAGH